MDTFLRNLLKNPLVLRMASLGDQVMFAAGNFLLTVLLTRFYNDTALAAYGIAVSVALILQSIQRNSYIVQHSLLDLKILKRRSKKIIAEQMIVVVPVLLLLAMASFIVVPFFGQSLFAQTLAACVACFAIYAQLEFDRIILMKYKKFLIPFATSFLYLLLSVILLLFHASLTFYQVIAILTVFACVKSLVLLYVVGRPDFRGGWALLRSDLRRNAPSSMLGVIGYSGYTHAPVLLLGLLSTPVQAAGFVAMRSLMQLLQIVIRSMDMIDKNFFRERASGSGQKIRELMNRQIFTYGIVSIIFSGLICIFGKQIINLLYVGEYIQFRNTLYPWAGCVIFFSLLQPLESAIIVKKLLNKYNVMRLWAGIATCIVLLFVVKPYGAMGAVIVSMIAGIAAFVAGYIMISRALRKRPS